jgi:PKD repeat protein
MIANTPPSIDITISSSDDGVTFTFNSTVSDVEGHVIAHEWFIDGILNSTEANITWQANQSGSYTVTFRATDDGGLWSEVSEVIEVTIVITEEKNFVATFSSKDIDVGDSLTITFTGTQGSVDHYEIIVNNPDGSRDTHETTENQFTLDFSVAGVYTLDVTVFWTDDIPQEFPLDYFGPTVYVGQDGVPTDNAQSPEDIADSSPLPSVSVIASLIMLSLLAVSRRQR